MQDFSITPWEVSGKVDYEKLIELLGSKPIREQLLRRIEKHTGKLHFMLSRGVFFTHRSLSWILDKYEKGEKFFLYPGRGPSGNTHLGHLIPWIFTKWLQDKFDAEVYFIMADDEKFLYNPNLTIKDTDNFAQDNILDVIACGFDPKKTFIFTNTRYAKTLYRLAIQVAKHITLWTAKAVFGFNNFSNIGLIFYPAMQIAGCFLPSVIKEKNIPCLAPHALDQDPYWRIAMDIAPNLGFYKPAQIYCKFMPGLGPGGKMSASDPNTAIFNTDNPETVRKKIMNMFTGQKPTIESRKKRGVDPHTCSVCQYYYFLFEDDNKKVEEIFEKERNGELSGEEHLNDLSERVVKFILEHQKRREKARNIIDKFILED